MYFTPSWSLSRFQGGAALQPPPELHPLLSNPPGMLREHCSLPLNYHHLASPPETASHGRKTPLSPFWIGTWRTIETQPKPTTLVMVGKRMETGVQRRWNHPFWSSESPVMADQSFSAAAVTIHHHRDTLPETKLELNTWVL